MTWALSYTLIPFRWRPGEAVKGQRVVEVNIYYRYFFFSLSVCVCVIRCRTRTEEKEKSVNEFLWGTHIIKCSTQM